MLGIHLTQVTPTYSVRRRGGLSAETEFDTRFATEATCRAYLTQLRWPAGFRCPVCGGEKAWEVRAVLWQCAACGLRSKGHTAAHQQ
jgi:ribosomal protein L37AE/L43A